MCFPFDSKRLVLTVRFISNKLHHCISLEYVSLFRILIINNIKYLNFNYTIAEFPNPFRNSKELFATATIFIVCNKFQNRIVNFQDISMKDSRLKFHLYKHKRLNSYDHK